MTRRRHGTEHGTSTFFLEGLDGGRRECGTGLLEVFESSVEGDETGFRDTGYVLENALSGLQIEESQHDR